MRNSFEKNVEGYNEVAKDRLKGGLTEEEERNLARELISKMRRAVKNRQSSFDAQKEIYDIQEEKQKIMQRLKEKIALLDDPHYNPQQRSDERLITKEGENYVVQGEKGAEANVTKGEIITDMEWGLYYHLDPTSIPRNVRKRYLIEDTKPELCRYRGQRPVSRHVA